MKRRSNSATMIASIALILMLVQSACNIQLAADPNPPTPKPTEPQRANSKGSDPSTLQNTDIKTEVSISVAVPADTPPGERIQLVVLDEVTGLPYHRTEIDMYPADATHYSVSFHVRLGTLIKYRFERVSEEGTTVEYTAGGEAVRYRLFPVDGPSKVHDVIARWADTPLNLPTGRIIGQILEAVSNQPVVNVLVMAAGQQAITRADGSFVLPNLAVGEHLVVAYAMDGKYLAAKQFAVVAEQAATPAVLTVTPSQPVEVSFVVSVPEGAITGVPVRLAGNLIQLGNTFTDLFGGVSGMPAQMPVLALDERTGIYSLTITLPAGVDIRYKYTIGDGYWNAEHTSSGAFRLRQLIIPEGAAHFTVTDQVTTWSGDPAASVWFDTSVPLHTPENEPLYIQFNDGEWMSPIPMWPISPGRWAFRLFNPPGFDGELIYRYCRNAQCGTDTPISIQASPDLYPFTFDPTNEIVNQDAILDWVQYSPRDFSTTVLENAIHRRDKDFLGGVAFPELYSPYWTGQSLGELQSIQSLNANTVMLRPTWQPAADPLPRLISVRGEDMPWEQTLETLQYARALGLKTVIFPEAHLNANPTSWWQAGMPVQGWWTTWLDEYRAFVLHFAVLAESGGADTLVLGGEWMTPALEQITEQQWISLLQDVRARFSGKLGWYIPFEDQRFNTPPVLDQFDAIYLHWGASLGTWSETGLTEMQSRAELLLDNKVQPLSEKYRLPVILMVGYPSADGGLTNCVGGEGNCASLEALSPLKAPPEGVTLDLREQMEVFNALFAAVNDREWIAGFIAEDYYPPIPLADLSASIHGKPAGDVLQYWFASMIGD